MAGPDGRPLIRYLHHAGIVRSVPPQLTVVMLPPPWPVEVCAWGNVLDVEEPPTAAAALGSATARAASSGDLSARQPSLAGAPATATVPQQGHAAGDSRATDSSWRHT